MTAGRESNWTEARVATLRRLAAEGLTGAEIAERLGVTRNTALGKLARLGVKLARPWGAHVAPDQVARMAWPAEVDAAFRAAVAEGASARALAERFDCAESAVRSRAALLGLSLRLVPHKPARPRMVHPVAGVVAAEPAAQPERRPTLLLDLRRGQCRFPLWADDAPEAARFHCGAPVAQEGSSWCAACRAVVFARPARSGFVDVPGWVPPAQRPAFVAAARARGVEAATAAFRARKRQEAR